jgi:hypothetical protein
MDFIVNRLLVALLISIGVSPTFANQDHPQPTTKPEPVVQNMPPDGWVGATAHVGISALFGVASRTLVFKDPVKAWALAMVPGVVKELQDYRKDTPGYRHGLFSRKDLISDAVGAAIGVYAGGVIVDKTGDKYRLTYFRSF